MRDPSKPEVTFVLPDSLGGVFTVVKGLLANMGRDRVNYRTVLTRNKVEARTRPNEQLPGCVQDVFHYQLPIENVYSVLRRLSKAIPSGPGVIVSNDLLELAMLTSYPKEQMVVQINHGDMDYYYQLAQDHEPEIDCYIAPTRFVTQHLKELLPHRTDSIVHLPYGVSIPDKVRSSRPGPLRLLFIGRLEEVKGVSDLPVIDAKLKEAGVDVTWTIQGAGKEEKKLKEIWPPSERCQWKGALPPAEVIRKYPEYDVLVMPSREEGLPMALLEAGAAGVVPVVSHLRCGLPEVVIPNQTGFLLPVGDTKAFAEAIGQLARNRELLEKYSEAVRRLVAEQFDMTRNARRYEEVFAAWKDFKLNRPHRRRRLYGSRLDQRWIPNLAVFPVRWLRKKLTGTTYTRPLKQTKS